MTDIKILLENFKKYSLKQEERRYNFEDDKKVANEMIDDVEGGFKHVDVSYEEGYEDDRHSEQDFDDYITDMSKSGDVNARIFIPVSEEESFVVPKGFFKDSIKPKEMELRKALIDKYGSDDMGTYGITPEFVSNNKANSRNFKGKSIAGVEIKLVGLDFDLVHDEEYSMEQLEKYLNFYKDIDNSFEQIKSDVLKSVAELKVKAEQFG